MLKGIAASAGIAVGRAVVIRPSEIDVVKRTVLYLNEEKQRFLDAVEVFVGELEEAREVVRSNVGKDEAAILGAQIAIIRDPELIKEVLRTIERQYVNAEYAFHSICNGYIALFSHLKDELLSARAADFQDIRNRMLRILLGIRRGDLSTVPAGSIIVAEDIPPSEMAGINTNCISGVLTRKGARFSHIAIIARALHLPAVVAVENLFSVLSGGETLILDGYNGCVWVNPDASQMEQYQQSVYEQLKRQEALEYFRDRPTCTSDGKRILLAANYAVEQELETICTDNADGIGLYRTEFLFMDCPAPPSEQEQYLSYKKAVTAMEGKPVVIRTLDIGGDKEIPYLVRGGELNPFLGYRAVRFCLDRPDIFKAQLAAILRVAALGDVSVMLPMITDISELHAVKRLLEEVVAELEKRAERFRADVPLGIMIETPAAVLCAKELARECSFFSIGTNDLTQYTIAVDRGNSNVAALYSTLHPAVLRMIAMTVEAAREAGIPISVCGESASDPAMLPFLIGAGVEKISVSSGAILATRSAVSGISFDEWRRNLGDILALHSVEDVKAYIMQRIEPAKET